MSRFQLSYRTALTVQLSAALLAAFIFPSGWVERRWAGVIAGSGFLLTSAGLAWLALRGDLGSKGRADLVVAGFGLAVLLGISLPMLATRVWYWNEGFATIEIWGLSGPQFHRVATWGYLGFMGAVGLRWAQERRQDW